MSIGTRVPASYNCLLSWSKINWNICKQVIVSPFIKMRWEKRYCDTTHLWLLKGHESMFSIKTWMQIQMYDIIRKYVKFAKSRCLFEYSVSGAETTFFMSLSDVYYFQSSYPALCFVIIHSTSNTWIIIHLFIWLLSNSLSLNAKLCECRIYKYSKSSLSAINSFLSQTTIEIFIETNECGFTK